MLNFTKRNYKTLVIGILTVILGYIILSWDVSNDPSVNAVAFHKLTIAPLIIAAGYVLIGVGIFIKEKDQHV